MDTKAPKLFVPSRRNSSAHRLIVALFGLLLLNILTPADSQTSPPPPPPAPSDKPLAYPAWWFSRGVILPKDNNNQPPLWNNGQGDYPPPDDYAAANIGQLKQMATQAAVELNTNLTGYGAGPTVTRMIQNWTQTPGTDDYAAINLGQLKAVAQPFYDQLILAHYTNNYPWANGTADDYSTANVGQLKYLFSFDLTYSSTDSTGTGTGSGAGATGIPDWWLLAAGLNPFDPTIASSPVANPTLTVDGAPMTYQQAYQAGINPVTAATSDPSNPASAPSPTNALQTLPTTTYVAIDVSSSVTNADVVAAALDENLNVGFYTNGTLGWQSYKFSNGNTSPGNFVATTGWVPASLVPFPSLNSNGDFGYVKEIVPGTGYAYINNTPYSPTGQGMRLALGMYGEGGFGGLNVGNSGLAIGGYGGQDVALFNYFQFEINNGVPTWWGGYDPNATAPPQVSLFNPLFFSPGGTAVGNLSSDGSYAVGDYGSYTSISGIIPMAISDNQIVVGNAYSGPPGSANPYAYVPVNSLSINYGNFTFPVSSLLNAAAGSFGGSICFPGNAAQSAWVDSQGDVVTTAQLFDVSDPSNKRWVTKTVLLRNTVGIQQGSPELSIVSFPSSLVGLDQFNGDACFAAKIDMQYEMSGPYHVAAALLVPVTFTLLTGSTPGLDGKPVVNYPSPPDYPNPQYGELTRDTSPVTTLGVAPMGQGRPDQPSGAYAFATFAVARAPQGLQYRWGRTVALRSWFIDKITPWYGIGLYSYWDVTLRKDVPNHNDQDTPYYSPYDTTTPSENKYEFYSPDASGLSETYLKDSVEKKGNFIYCEKNFVYTVQVSVDGVSWVDAVDASIIQRITVKYATDGSYNVAHDWVGVPSQSQGNTMMIAPPNTLTITPEKVQAIVGAGASIKIENGANP